MLLIATPMVFTAIDDAITESTSNSFASVSGSDNASVVLGTSLYNDNVQSVLGVTSNSTLDTPTAYTYNSVSKALVVSGLGSVTRTLTVEYMIDSTTLPDGAVLFLTLLRWFWPLVIVGMTCGSIYAFFD